jgi:catechol 2,3-dioxygenase-like lactoylglutathione lyase family enzyme
MVRAKRGRGKVVGIGGVFFKSRDPEKLYRWYETHLGFKRAEFGAVLFSEDQTPPPHRPGITVWAIFPSRTHYFAPTKAKSMINYRVDDLDALHAKLRRQRVWIDPRQEDSPQGRFAWIRDRDGNRIELWEPPGPVPRRRKTP